MSKDSLSEKAFAYIEDILRRNNQESSKEADKKTSVNIQNKGKIVKTPHTR